MCWFLLICTKSLIFCILGINTLINKQWSCQWWQCHHVMSHRKQSNFVGKYKTKQQASHFVWHNHLLDDLLGLPEVHVSRIYVPPWRAWGVRRKWGDVGVWAWRVGCVEGKEQGDFLEGDLCEVQAGVVSWSAVIRKIKLGGPGGRGTWHFEVY